MEVRRIAEVASYHAHVYFDPATQAGEAAAIREAAGQRFAVRLGTVHRGPVGPHSQAMFQIAFEPALFGTLVPWLMLNHRGLSILVHPNTANEKRDHLIDAIWIGCPVAIDEGPLPAETEPMRAGEVNTAPSLAP